MPRRPRYPSTSAIVHIALRTAGIIVNVLFLVSLGYLTKIYHLTFPAAYVAACWALCADALELGILLNKSRSIPRPSGGGQLTLDLIGVFLLVPAAFLNWYGSGSYGDYERTSPKIEAYDWGWQAIWVGAACLGMRLILSVAVCVNFCIYPRR